MEFGWLIYAERSARSDLGQASESDFALFMREWKRLERDLEETWKRASLLQVPNSRNSRKNFRRNLSKNSLKSPKF